MHAAVTMPENFRSSALADALTDRKLELTLFPTEQCSFRCTYCYEDFELGRMSRDTVSGIKALVTRRSGDLDRLQVSWFGGEPLMAYDIVKDVSEHCLRLSRENGYVFFNGMTTNAYALNARRAVELADLGVTNYQVSLDGSPEDHNQTRIRRDGAETFDVIWNNVCSFNDLKESGHIESGTITLRIHVHPNNAAGMQRLVDRIVERLSPRHIRVFPKLVGRYGGKNDKELSVFKSESSDAELALSALRAGLSDFISVGSRPGVCYACKANAFTIRADGSVGKCTVALKSDKNRVGRITEDGRFMFEQEKVAAWLHPLNSMLLDDLRCPAHKALAS